MRVLLVEDGAPMTGGFKFMLEFYDYVMDTVNLNSNVNITLIKINGLNTLNNACVTNV